MRKRGIYLGLLLLAVAIGAIVVCSKAEREPEYGGKKLSEWVEVLSSCALAKPNRTLLNFDGLWLARKPEERIDGVEHIGAESLPYLLDRIRYEPPPIWQDKT